MASTAPILQIVQVFQCNICHTSLAATSLKRHKRTVHGDRSAEAGRQWVCKVCGKSLQTQARLIQHEHSHSRNLKENVFSCEECQYFTNNKDYMTDHMRRMHRAKEGMWMCMQGTCKNRPKSFINNHLLAAHQKNHDNFPCPKCKKSFGAKRNMLRHLKTVHKKQAEHDTTGNSNNSENDMNLNFDPVDIANVDLDQAIVLPFDLWIHEDVSCSSVFSGLGYFKI